MNLRSFGRMLPCSVVEVLSRMSEKSGLLSSRSCSLLENAAMEMESLVSILDREQDLMSQDHYSPGSCPLHRLASLLVMSILFDPR